MERWSGGVGVLFIMLQNLQIKETYRTVKPQTYGFSGNQQRFQFINVHVDNKNIIYD